MNNENLILGLTYLYNSENNTTTVSWAYRDSPDLEYFIIEYYDEIEKEWKPYDNHMGIVEKENK